MSNKKLTLTGLAKLAGVSTSTVSRALNNNPLIKQQTRERIQQLAKQHNFSLNRTASRLRTQKSNVIAVILNLVDHTEQSINDPFLLKMVADLNLALNKQGYELLLSNSLMATENWAHYFVHSQRADGLIIIGQGKTPEKINLAAAEQVPMVVWGDAKQDSNYPIIGSNNFVGGLLATEHLLQQGCKHLIFLGDPEHREMKQRYLGFQQAIAQYENSVSAEVQSIDITSSAAYQKISQLLLAGGLQFDGIVAASDMVALGAMKALKERYIGIPNDVAIVGFDDIPLAELLHPALTTIQQNTQLAAEMMVAQLINQFNQQAVQSHTLDVKLIKRNSTR